MQNPYEVDVAEDEDIGRTILKKILVEDQDSVGDNLEVGCVPNQQVYIAIFFIRVTNNYNKACKRDIMNRINQNENTHKSGEYR